MKALNFISFFLIAFCFCIQAQEVSISEDMILKNDRAYFLVGELEDKFILFRDMDGEYRMHSFDKKMLPVNDVEFEFDYRSVDILDVLPNGKEHFNIYYTAKKKNTFYFMLEKYNLKAELLESLVLQEVEGIFDTPEYEVVYSEDENLILFYNIESKSELETIVVKNDDLEILSTQTFNESELDLYYNLNEILLSNKGEVYIITEKYNGIGQKKNPGFKIFNSKLGQEKLESFKIEFGDKKNYYAKFVLDNLNNRITAGGLYAEKNLMRANGYYFLSMPLSNKAAFTLSYNPFDEEFLKEYLGRKSVSRKAGLLDGTVQEIILRRDGGILLIGEKVKRKNRQSPSVNHRTDVSFRADYYFEELFLISIHPDGKEHWKNIIHKRQFSYDDEAVFSSFYPVKTSNSLNILFNDDIRTQSTVSEFRLNAVGEYKRRAVLNTKDLEIKLRVKDALQIAANTIVVPSQYRNKLKLVKFEF